MDPKIKAARIAAFIREHYLPAVVTHDLRILTEDRYTDPEGIDHADPIDLPADIRKVRQWLGY